MFVKIVKNRKLNFYVKCNIMRFAQVNTKLERKGRRAVHMKLGVLKMQSMNNISKKNQEINTLDFFGEPGGIRTPDTGLRRPVLYPPELLTHS